MKKGFTLVELSIVLVIIGLLIGGLLVGQSLIDSARINKIGRDVSQYKVLVAQFQNKFKCLPGDCSKAFIASTLRGDGNNRISKPEGLSALSHLKIGGLYSSNNDLSNCAYYVDRTNTNCWLKSNIKNSIYWILSVSGWDCNGTTCDLFYGPAISDAGTEDGEQYISLGSATYLSNSSNDNIPGALINSTFAKAIDAKFDDGLPNVGKVKAAGDMGPAYYQCATNWGLGGTYAGTQDGCIMFFYLGKFDSIEQN